MVVTALSICSTDQNGQNISTTSAPTGVSTNNVPGYPGWSGVSYNYLATATVSSTGQYGVYASTVGGVATSDNTVTITRYFQVTTVPLFQAAIFYENCLEIHPGAKMVVSGLVHTNDSLYALGIGAQVQFLNNVSYVNSYSEGSNPAVRWGWDGSNTSAANTPENIDALYQYYYGTNSQDLWKDGLPSSSSATRASQINQVSTIDPFGGANQGTNGLYSIIQVPAAGSAAAASDQVAYNNASLRVTHRQFAARQQPRRALPHHRRLRQHADRRGPHQRHQRTDHHGRDDDHRPTGGGDRDRHLAGHGAAGLRHHAHRRPQRHRRVQHANLSHRLQQRRDDLRLSTFARHHLPEKFRGHRLHPGRGYY